MTKTKQVITFAASGTITATLMDEDNTAHSATENVTIGSANAANTTTNSTNQSAGQ